MEKLFDIITNFYQASGRPEQLLGLLSEQMRDLYGACATALVCKEQLPTHSCRIIALYDHTGKTVVENFSLDATHSENQVFTDSFLDELLSPTSPIIHKGKSPGIHPIFASVFDDYMDAITFPLYQPNGAYRWLVILFTSAGKVDKVNVERSLLLATLAINYVANVVDARRLQEANQWIEKELEALGKIQNLLLPQDLTNIPGIKVSKRFVPHAYVGGDYYDVAHLTPLFDLDDGSENANMWGFMVADASGHGAAAAVEIAMFDAIIRTYPPNFEAGPAGLLNYANKYFFTRMLRGGFITAIVSGYHAGEHRFSYANAGHPAPILKTEKNPGELLRLDNQVGIPLGVLKEQHWQNTEYPMYPGDTVIFYTDGIIEAASPSGHQFGLLRLESIIRDCGNEPETLLAAIETELLAHQQDTLQNDDQTLLIIQAQE